MFYYFILFLMDNKKEEKNSDNKTNKKCGNPSCNKDGKLRCPNCTKLKIEEGSYFCAQDCFKICWSSHKKIHDECNISYNNRWTPRRLLSLFCKFMLI